MPTFITYLAEAYAKAGQPGQALKKLEEAAAIVESTQNRCDEANMHRLKGDLLITLGDTPSAERCFLESLGVARRQSARLWELRASISLGHLLTGREQYEDARDLISRTRGWFTEGLDTVALRQAEVMIASVTRILGHYRIDTRDRSCDPHGKP